MPKLTGPARWLMMLYATLLVLIGLALAIPGVRLLMLGGSAYYLIAGLATIAAGILLLFGKWRGAIVYAAMMLGTILWALWEVGLDGWGLVPRLVAPIVLGVPLLIGALLAAFPHRKPIIWGGTLVAILLIVIGIYGLREQPDGPAETATPTIASVAGADWPYYGNSQAGSRFSPAAQITPQNAGRLQLAWSTHVDQPMNGALEARFEGTPLKVGDFLYACTGLNDVIAMDPATGQIRWRFYAHTDGKKAANGNCRGLAYYHLPNATGACASRIYTATIDARLLAIDALTGRPCAGFGTAGSVDLLKQMGQTIPGYYSVTSAPQLVHGKLVIGGFVADGQMLGEPSGVIRAYDAVTGELAWAWDMGRPDLHGAPPAGETFTKGTPNSWAPMSADDKLGLVYVPTGNATPDYFGGHRSPASEKYSSSLVAIDADTGIVRWSFQAVHHDVWDYDLSVQPQLIDLPMNGKIVPIVVQATKNGEMFVLNRVTGKPVYPIVERPVPQGAVPGDWLSPTQPHSPTLDFIGPRLTEKDMWGATPLDQLWCRIKFREARYDGPFTPLGLKPVILQPGFSGGTEWGSTSYDPVRGLLLLASNYIVNYNQLMPRGTMNAMGIYPSKDPRTIDWSTVPQGGTPYGAHTTPFQSPTGTPCEKPPYSRLNAVDLKTGKLMWSRPLGTARSIGPYGTQSMLPLTIGTPSFGGSITTAGGVTFIAASLDHSLRAFETKTGRLLWRGDLPADGLATPLTYTMGDGRQFVVIGAGDKAGGMRTAAGHSDGHVASTAGGTFVAFALPRR